MFFYFYPNKLYSKENPYRYASYFYDEESGLYYVKARYYNPEIGRFLTRDNMPNHNLYVYAANNPITYGDGTGNFLDTILDVASVVMSTVDFVKKPSWKTGLTLAWDVAATIIPGVPGSYVAKAAKATKSFLGAKLSKFVSKFKKSDTMPIGANCSFTAGTTVQTPDGDVPIESIKVGDYVLAKSDKTGELAYKKVVELFPHDKEEIYELHLDGEVIETTEEHPFWIEEKQKWLPVRDLTIGDKLQDKNGNPLTIHDIIIKEGNTKVFNFEVEDFHTYFVGENDVWTHNACPRKPKSNVINQVEHNDGSISFTKKANDGEEITIKYNSSGYPDFSGYSISEVKINYTNDRNKDFELANEKAGFDITPEGFTWHHVEDAKTMQLVPTKIHGLFPHTGGFSIFKNSRTN